MELPWQQMGSVAPPATITQEAFDRDDGHLRRLVRLRPGQRAEASDLWNYAQDLRYTEIQGTLLAYLLPFCLEAWREDLRGVDGYGGFVENFYLVLADHRIFDAHLNPKQTAAISEFMRQTILQEINEQRGLFFQGMAATPYRWFRALATYGVVLPDVNRLWTAWWSIDTIGGAISAVQYISCLMYSEYKNPVFSPWTGDSGGGPPCLWEFGGHLYTHRWLEPNVTFLKEILRMRRVGEVLSRAVERLTGQPEHDVAASVHADLPLCLETLEFRCSKLPLLLATTQQPNRPLEWSRNP
ncbi:MAG: hypothetical protein WA755_07025 [Candidatus Acidiferrales bacterium]